MMEAATEKGEEEGVLREGVHRETDRGGSGTERKRGTRTAAETATKVESEGRKVKTGSAGGVTEAKRSLTGAEASSASVRVSHLRAQSLIAREAHSRKRRRGTNRRR